MHPQQAADPLPLLPGSIENHRAVFQPPRIDAGESQLADKRINHDFKDQCRKWSVFGREAKIFPTGFKIKTLHRAYIYGGGKKCDYRIQQGLNSLVAVRRAAKNRYQGMVDRRLAQSAAAFFRRNLLTVKIFFHQAVIILGRGFQDPLPEISGLFAHRYRDFRLAAVNSQIVFIDNRPLPDQVDHT